MQNKRILLFTDCLGAGGAQRQLAGLAVMLKEKGYEVKVCYYYESSFYYQYLDENSVRHELIPHASNHIKRFPNVARYFKKQKPDWVIAYQETPSIVACCAKLIGGKFKLMVSERSTTQILTNKVKIRFLLYKFADIIVPNSFSQGDFIRKYFPSLAKKISVIPNFVDLNKFKPCTDKINKHKIIVVASVTRHKNVLNFIRAVKILKDRQVSFKAEWYGVISGTSDVNKLYYDQCLNLIDELAVADVIKLLPKTTEIAAKYQSADYFCLPSLYEGTPNVICEAMATGLPIICSNVCDNPRYVHENENGFLFDPSCPEDIANKLSQALSLPDSDYINYCRTSRQLAESLLSGDSFINKYIKIIES